MTSIYFKANHFDKEFLYEHYLLTVTKPVSYEKITRKKMLEAIIDYYNAGDHLLYSLSLKEITLLKEILNKKKKALTDHNKKLFIQLESKLVLDYSYYLNEVEIYDEFYDKIKAIVSKAETQEGKKLLELQQISIGLCNAYGILTEEEFYDSLQFYIKNFPKEEMKQIIFESDYFSHRLAILEITYDNIPVTLYTYYNLEQIADFLETYIDVLSLPKYDFTYDEIIDYANYDINYRNATLQRLLKSMDQLMSYFNEEHFLEIVQSSINLLLDPNLIKKYIYEYFPHYERKTDCFFDLMDLCDELNETLNTWTARGYPVSKMTDLLSGIQMDSMKKMEKAYRYKTGLEPEDDLNDFLDFIESVTDDEVEAFLDTKDKTRLN